MPDPSGSLCAPRTQYPAVNSLHLAQIINLNWVSGTTCSRAADPALPRELTVGKGRWGQREPRGGTSSSEPLTSRSLH